MDYTSYSIDYRLRGYAGELDDPTMLSTEIVGDINQNDEDEGVLCKAGLIEIRFFNIYLIKHSGWDEFTIFDSIDGDIAEAYETFFDVSTGEPIDNRIITDKTRSIMIINRCRIGYSHKGRRIGLKAIADAIRTFATTDTLVLMKPFPLQIHGCIEHEEELGFKMRLDKYKGTHDEALQKLIKHYSTIGFRTAGRTEYMYFLFTKKNISTLINFNG